MQEIYQDEIEKQALIYRGLNPEILLDHLKELKAMCQVSGNTLENSRAHALDLLAILNEIARQNKIMEFPDDIIKWMTAYLVKRNKERPEVPKIVSIW